LVVHVFFGVAALAQAEPVRPDPERMRKDLEILAGDAFEGRNSGQPGGDKAAAWLRDQLRPLGLRPLGEDFYQTFEFTTGGTRKRKVSTQNVVAWIEGADERHKAEAVVIGAHYDHVGKRGEEGIGRLEKPGADPADEVWNGADDNGSGTVTVLEIARALSGERARPKRSVVFAWFGAEEYGLVGSAHFVRHVPAPFARERIVAMLNLDMVGRSVDRAVDVGCAGTSAAWGALLDRCSGGLGLKLARSDHVHGGSDHASFTREKIPALSFFTGFHADYHRKTDHADLIQYETMARIGALALRLVTGVGNLDERPAWKEPPRPPVMKTLGFRPGDAVEGGVSVKSVEAGSVAEKGGLKAGDVIEEFDGKRLPKEGAFEELRRRIQAVETGRDVALGVARRGERVTLTVRWEKP
jgi:hypothetical protein